MKNIIALDVGQERTAWVIVNKETMQPIKWNISMNEDIMISIGLLEYENCDSVIAINRGASAMSMFWAGRIYEKLWANNVIRDTIYNTAIDKSKCRDFVRNAPDEWFKKFNSHIMEAYFIAIAYQDYIREV